MGWYSAINTAFSRHFDYFTPTDINDPDNLIHRDADGTTYMLIKADVLPMLKWMAAFTPAERMAELDAKYRPLVERDYDPPEYVEQGEGADWGNGNPPPAFAADGVQQMPVEIPREEDDGDPEADLPVPADSEGGRDDPEEPERAKGAVDSDDESGESGDDEDESDGAGETADDDSDDDSDDDRAAADAALIRANTEQRSIRRHKLLMDTTLVVAAAAK